MASEDQNRIDDTIIAQFQTFEDFLDSQITPLDLYYLEVPSPLIQDDELARQLVELGYRGSGEVLKREEFDQRKAENEAAKLTSKFNSKSDNFFHFLRKIASLNKEISDVFLKELAAREEANRSGKLSVLLFKQLGTQDTGFDILQN
ncbi:cilia- and flagella-associated protein 299-like [Octopus sinensis]|uniref:Cilia- and flagella-associated protein 299 n=1 Tax=Octopus sinensis TaxID=2607531 RepID=A0A7E6EIU4_9MOLL|nr:cilia- and flagella-associated protein 299-like [Octopus sinensis]